MTDPVVARGPWPGTPAGAGPEGEPPPDPPDGAAAPEPPARPSRKKTFKRRFEAMLGRDDPAELVAASFAVGVAISFTPLFGFHWVIAALFAWLLRLKMVDVFLGTLVVNPLTVIPVATVAIPIGRFVLRARREAIAHLPWHEMLSPGFWTQAAPKMRAIGLQLATGMFVLSFLAGAVTYAVMLRLIRLHRARVAAACAAARDQAP